MSLTALHSRLMAVARKHPPSDRVPYAFEKRVMARLKALPQVHPLAFWGRSLWRAAVPCLVVMAVCVAWSLNSPRPTASEPFSQQFEKAVLVADTEPLDETW